MGEIMKARSTFIVIGAISSFVLIGLFQNCSQTNFSASLSEKIVGMSCTSSDSVSLAPKLKWDWYQNLDKSNPNNYPEFDQVMSTPMAADINNNGNVEVVFTSFKPDAHTTDKKTNRYGYRYYEKGILRIVDGRNGRTIKSFGGSESEDPYAPSATISPLLIDLDGDGKMEIVYIGYKAVNNYVNKVIALNSDGSFRWMYEKPPTSVTNGIYTGLSAGDFNKDGRADIILAGEVIIEGFNKKPYQLFKYESTSQQNLAYSLNPDKPNDLQIVTNQGVFDNNGNKLFSLENSDSNKESAHAPLYITVADIYPERKGLEIIGSGNGKVSIYDGISGERVVSVALQVSQIGVTGGGITAIGNFDDNPQTTEIALATRDYLLVYDKNLNLIASTRSRDFTSSYTGISSFDLNGDGKPEIIYADEEYLSVYELRNGELTVVQKILNPSGTLAEYPVFVDLDNNGFADLLVASNNFFVDCDHPEITKENERDYFYYLPGQKNDCQQATRIHGVRAFEADSEQGKRGGWMPTRNIQNQYYYNPMLVTDKGSAVKQTYFTDYLVKTFGRNMTLGLFEPTCQNIVE